MREILRLTGSRDDCIYLCRLRPEGPARSHGTWHASPGKLAPQGNRNPAPAHGTRSKTIVLFSKGGTYLGTPTNTTQRPSENWKRAGSDVENAEACRPNSMRA